MPSIDEDIKIGPREAPKKPQAETVRNLTKDRTLLVAQLTAEAPIEPEIATDLKTIEDVFKRFMPETSAEFKGEDGQFQTEVVKFTSLGGFGPKGVMKQSEFLMNIQQEIDLVDDLIRQLRSNSALQKVLENPDTKEAFLNALGAMIDELPE